MSLTTNRGKFIKGRIRDNFCISNGHVNTKEENEVLYQLYGEIGDDGEDMSGQCILNPIYREAVEAYDKLHPSVIRRIQARGF